MTFMPYSILLICSSIQKYIVFGFSGIRVLRPLFLFTTFTSVTSIVLLTTIKGPWTSSECPFIDDFCSWVLYLYSKPWDLSLSWSTVIYFTGCQITHLHVPSLSQFLHIKKQCIVFFTQLFNSTWLLSIIPPLLSKLNFTCGQSITTVSFVP